MGKFWKITDEYKIHLGVKLYRIELTIDCKWGDKGDKGGFLEKECNLLDNAWVSGNALVYDNAEVSDNARVSGSAEVYGDAWVSGNALVYDNAMVYGDAWVYGNALVYGSAEVSGNARISGNVFTLNFIYNLTLTDNHIKYGCIQKKINEWVEWLNSDEIIETKRDNEKFKIIEMSLRLAIEQHKQLNK